MSKLKNPCSRCPTKSKKESVTGPYPAISDWGVSPEYASENAISNPEHGAKGKLIQTCNICTSPTSRTKFHNKNQFKRYEHQFLNRIIETAGTVP
jgi:hypothetical protein